MKKRCVRDSDPTCPPDSKKAVLAAYISVRLTQFVNENTT